MNTSPAIVARSVRRSGTSEKLVICTLTLLLAACATVPVQTTAWTWMISAQVPFSGPTGALNQAIIKANNFCASQRAGRVAKLVSNTTKECMLHGGCGEAQITFICATSAPSTAQR
ncbi:MAG TPA: hypothetical protein VHX52_10180 [Steroidobacteraceae bacterium]|nr:hypothetical protein [Steroidobacteraceae bacterium]